MRTRPTDSNARTLQRGQEAAAIRLPACVAAPVSSARVSGSPRPDRTRPDQTRPEELPGPGAAGHPGRAPRRPRGQEGGPRAGCLGVLLGSSWGPSSWGPLRVLLGSSWGPLRVLLGFSWAKHAGCCTKSSWQLWT